MARKSRNPAPAYIMPFARISRLAAFALLLILGRHEALAQELTGLAGAIKRINAHQRLAA